MNKKHLYEDIDSVNDILCALHNVAQSITDSGYEDLQDIVSEAYRLADKIEDEGPTEDSLYSTDEVAQKLWDAGEEDLAETIWDATAIFRQSLQESTKYKEDFEFYRKPGGQIDVDKVVTTGSRSGLSFRDGTPNRGGDTSNVVRRVPYEMMSPNDKELAKAAYKTLKTSGDIAEVDKRFKTSPQPDVVTKADGVHADIYYDDNTTGVPDEKNVRLAASKKRTAYQKLHSLKEDTQ